MKRENIIAWLDAVRYLPDKNKLRQAWIDLIEKNKPDLWVTVTFAGRDTSGLGRKKFALENAEELALRRFKQFLKHLNQKRFVFYDKYILCFLVVEKNPSGKGVHIHALIKGIKPELASKLEQRCRYAFGISKVVAFDYSIKPYSAIDYVVDKYVFFRCDNLMFYKINSRYRGKGNKGFNKPDPDPTPNPN